MAKGYYMATGRPQVILTHVLTGLLHGAMELKAAYTDQIPLIMIVGHNRTHDNEVYGGTPGPHYLSFTEVGGQIGLVRPYVKWADNPETKANLLDIIQRAYRIANTSPKGPVLLSISRELLFEKTTEMKLPEPLPVESRNTCDPASLEKLKKLLLEAENPLIYTRYLGRNHEAVEELVKLTSLLGIPVFELPGYMNYPTDSPLHMGNNILPYVEDADLLLVIDSSSWPPWYPPGSIRGKTNAKIVFIDPDPVQQKYPVYGYPSDLSIKGDSKEILRQLNNQLADEKIDPALTQQRLERWTLEHHKIRAELEKKPTWLKMKPP